jgi:hypothetical protein
MKSRFAAVLAFSAAAALLVGCEQVPSQAISDAKNALKDAENAGARIYAPAQLKAAQISFELAAKEIDVERRKLPISRKYDKIIEALKSATSAAKSAEAAVDATKKQIRAEATDLLAAAQTVADKAGKKITSLPRNKKAAVAAELDTLTAALKEANDALAGENLLVAKEKAAVAKEKSAALEGAFAKPAAAKKTKSAGNKK